MKQRNVSGSIVSGQPRCEIRVVSAMRNKILTLLFVLIYISVNIIQCSARGGGRGGGSHSSGHSSSHGHSSGHSWGKGFGSSWGSGSKSSSYGSHSYPSSSSGLSGSSSYGSHSYPSSSSGLSGSSSYGSHSYPSSGSGLSGSGSSNYPKYGSYGQGSSSYGHGSSSYGHGSSGYGQGSSSYGSYKTYYNVPSYYTAPQHVYITEYRSSNSPYSDLLTGLTMYNLGRSHHDYHHQYYYDDYYRTRYHPGSTSYSSSGSSMEQATCTLRIKENENIKALKIPCEIVSTFTEGSNKESICVTNSTTTNNTLTNVSSNVTVVNSTSCSSPVDTIDPMSATGSRLDSRVKECSVEIKTKDTYLVNKLNCDTLLEYAKMKEPTKDNGVLPSRGKLKSWLSKPPWWLSTIIAV